MIQQLLHQIDVTAFFIDALRKGFSEAVRRDLTIQPRRDKRLFQHLMCGLSVHLNRTRLMPRWEQRTATLRCVVLLPVPRDKILNCLSAVLVDRHGTAHLTTFDDGFLKEQIGHGASRF